MAVAIADSLHFQSYKTEDIPSAYTTSIAAIILEILDLKMGDAHSCSLCCKTPMRCGWPAIAFHDQAKSLWYVTCCGNQFVGFARICGEEILMLGVVSQFRGHGVGRAIVKTLASYGYVNYKLRMKNRNALPFFVRTGCPATEWTQQFTDSPFYMRLKYSGKV